MSKLTATERAVEVFLDLMQRIHPDDKTKFCEICMRHIVPHMSIWKPLSVAFDAIPKKDRWEMFREFLKLRYND